MALGFLSRLFARGSSEAPPDLSGPLALVPGDRVEYYQQHLVVTGIVVLAEGNERRHQYHLADPDGRPFVLVAEADPDLVLSFQRPLDEGEEPPTIRVTAATWAGRAYARTHEGKARALCVGDIPPEKSGEVETLEFEDEEGMSILVAEQWGQFSDLRAGEYVHEGEIVVHRQGDDEYEARPPPRVDLKSMNEARHARAAIRVVSDPLDAAGVAARRREERAAEMEQTTEPAPDQASRS